MHIHSLLSSRPQKQRFCVQHRISMQAGSFHSRQATSRSIQRGELGDCKACRGRREHACRCSCMWERAAGALGLGGGHFGGGNAHSGGAVAGAELLHPPAAQRANVRYFLFWDAACMRSGSCRPLTCSLACMHAVHMTRLPVLSTGHRAKTVARAVMHAEVQQSPVAHANALD